MMSVSSVGTSAPSLRRSGPAPPAPGGGSAPGRWASRAPKGADPAGALLLVAAIFVMIGAAALAVLLILLVRGRLKARREDQGEVSPGNCPLRAAAFAVVIFALVIPIMIMNIRRTRADLD